MKYLYFISFETYDNLIDIKDQTNVRTSELNVYSY